MDDEGTVANFPIPAGGSILYGAQTSGAAQLDSMINGINLVSGSPSSGESFCPNSNVGLFGTGGSGGSVISATTGASGNYPKLIFAADGGGNGYTAIQMGSTNAFCAFASNGVSVNTCADPGANTFSAAAYKTGSTAGVDCTGVTAGTVTVAKGIVTLLKKRKIR